MIALDTNILVYAHRRDVKAHEEAFALVTSLMRGPEAVGLCWPVLHEFLAVVTNPRTWLRPTPMPKAVEQVRLWVEAENSVTLFETSRHLEILNEVMNTSDVVGGAVHDARIAAICLGNGAREIWSADRTFPHMPRLRVINPFADPPPATPG